MKRKFLCLLLALCMVLGLAATVSAEEEIITSGDWTYKVVDGDAVLTNYLGTATDVVVPAEIDGLKVAVLGDDSPDYTVFRDIQLTSVQLPEGLEHIGVSCFAGQESLTEVVIPDSITTIFYHVFSGCTGLKSVKLPETLTLIESFAFSGCTALETIEFPESLEYIEQYAFKNCTGLKELCVPCNTGFWAFHGCTSLEKVTYSGESVGTMAFEGCPALTEVILTDNVKALGEAAFANTGLTSIFIPASVTTMEHYCVGFNADVNETGWINSVDRLTDFVIRGYADTEAERYASFFRFTFVDMGGNYDNSGRCGDGSAFWEYTAATRTLHIFGHDGHGGYMYDYDEDEIPWLVHMPFITNVVVEDVRNICEYAFQGCAELTTVTMSDTVEAIDSCAFKNTPKLTDVKLSANLDFISGEAFSHSGLTSIELPESLTGIGTHAFEFTPLTSIDIPDSVELSQGAFYYCTELASVKLPADLEEIIPLLFQGCTSLKSIDLPENLIIIGRQAFSRSGLTSIEIPDSVVLIDENAFYECMDLEYVKLPASLEEAGWRCFQDCDKLSTIVMPEGIDPDFTQCCFLSCDSLTDIDFHTAPTIGYAMYQNCDGLTNLVIPDCVTSIGMQAFAFCDNLIYATVPASVTTFDAKVFYECPKLGAIAFRGDAPAFHEFAFEDTTVTCYYPADNATWTEEVRQSYNGEVTWIPYEVLPFTDVPVNSFYYAPVDWAVDNAITNGATETTFNPNGQCQRGQIVTFLWRAAGCPVVEAENPFTDVKETDFYYDAVLWAVEMGITNGTTETTFSPFKVCTRAEVVTFLWRAYGCLTVETTEQYFSDVDSDDFFFHAAQWAYAAGIANGIDDTHFAPYSVCNRAQVVTFLYRAKDFQMVEPAKRYSFELRTNDPTEEIGFAYCEGTEFAAGETVTFYAEPWFGYLVEFSAEPSEELELYYLGAYTYELVMPDHDVVLTANFVSAPGEPHTITTACENGFALAVCDTDDDLNSIAKAGEFVQFFIVPEEGFGFAPENFTVTANGQTYEDWWYLGELVEEDPELGTIDGIFIVELLMPDADVSVSITCTPGTSPAAAETRIGVSVR